MKEWRPVYHYSACTTSRLGESKSLLNVRTVLPVRCANNVLRCALLDAKADYCADNGLRGALAGIVGEQVVVGVLADLSPVNGLVSRV